MGKKSRRYSEIGSDFWLSYDLVKDLKEKKHSTLMDRANLKFTSTGRQAIKYAIRDIKESSRGAKRILLPSYTCQSVIDPAIEEGLEIFFYKVDKKLEIKLSQLNEIIDRDKIDILLIHPYFGFSTILEDVSINENVNVIFDQTQSLYSAIDYDFVDYKVASLRKWGPYYDGGSVEKLKGDFIYNPKLIENRELIRIFSKAFNEKYSYIEKKEGEKELFLGGYAKGLQLIRSKNTIDKMSEEARLIYSLDCHEENARIRRENYSYLFNYKRWGTWAKPVFGSLNDREVPLNFPIYVKDRDDFRSFMTDRSIYLPIIWPRHEYSEREDDDLNYIYSHIISIPIDQRYGKEDMQYILSMIDDYLEG